MVSEEKRGLSPIIATVLLIALAMVLAMIVFLWARGWLFEQIEKKGQPIDIVCEGVKISVDHQILGGEAGEVIIHIVNQGSVQIYALDIKQEGGGKSISSTFEIKTLPGQVSKEIRVPIVDINKLTIYPMLLGNVRGKDETKAMTCLNNGKVINL